eukprot:TRINITY_DN2085_c0_g1_i1.p1 TRINITY_DN2085_c0_g1~~TRINITY_DN2085_c0_g1_i1.p1  ORF type:complete len:468 (+),score=94.55 TRINITY_DN2085_c0_g1_i1:89-1405(+)
MRRTTRLLSLFSRVSASSFRRNQLPTQSNQIPLRFWPGKMQVRNLNLQEYRSKELLKEFGATTQPFVVACTPTEAAIGAKKLGGELVVKAQILAGGRGKGTFDNGFKGGVHLCHSPEEASDLTEKMLGHNLVTKQTGPAGAPVRQVMIAQSIDIKDELYFAIVLDRQHQGPVLIASPQGGMDIEQVAEESPEAIFKEIVNVDEGLKDSQTRNLAQKLGFTDEAQIKDAQKQMSALYDLFVKKDATQVEINPLTLAGDGKIYCVDAKINFDDNAQFRQKEVFAMGDDSESDPREVQAAKFGLNYIGMDGNIGCMVNGAGLAMATMDIIKMYNGSPANFLDVGGGADEEQVAQAFNILTSDSQVQAILVNIFGGIMKCDVIAQGIINAAKQVKMELPLVIRLAGTNVERGQQLLKESGLKILIADDLDDAAQKAVQSIKT